MNNKPLWFTVGAYVIWGIMPAFWKTLTGVGAMYTLCVRVLFSLVISVIVISATRRWSEIGSVLRNRRLFWLSALGGVFMCLNWGVFILATQIGRITEISISGYLVPLLMMLSGRLFFKEKLNAFEYGAAVLAGAGVLYLILAVGVMPYMAIIMACAFTGYGCVKKLTNIDSNVSLAVENITMAPLTLAYVLWAELSGHGAVGVLANWSLLLLPCAGIVTFIPLYMYGYGVTKMRYALVAMIQYICPTIQLLLGVFVYGESFTTMHLVTFIFIWLAVMSFIAGQQYKNHKAKALVRSTGSAA